MRARQFYIFSQVFIYASSSYYIKRTASCHDKNVVVYSRHLLISIFVTTENRKYTVLPVCATNWQLIHFSRQLNSPDLCRQKSIKRLQKDALSYPQKQNQKRRQRLNKKMIESVANLIKPLRS